MVPFWRMLLVCLFGHKEGFLGVYRGSRTVLVSYRDRNLLTYVSVLAS